LSCPSGKRALPLCERRLEVRKARRGKREIIGLGDTFAAPFVLAHDVDGIRKWLEYISAIVPVVTIKNQITLGLGTRGADYATFCSSLLLL